MTRALRGTRIRIALAALIAIGGAAGVMLQSGLVILLYTSCRLSGLGKVGWWRGRAKRGAGRWAICDDMVDRPIHH